jgi:drug/metabolite transporter (DMT)-like permease
MTGLLLVLFGALSAEMGSSIGKREIQQGRESIYMMGFLDALWGVLLYVGILAAGSDVWKFSIASFPTFGLRAVLEIILAHISVIAITKADRSAYGFIRIGTIPLLLAVDVTLGYTLTGAQFTGIGIIMCALALLLVRRGLGTKGIWYVLSTTLIAVVTLSLFKHNITHFNSVAAEQTIILTLLLAYFFLMACIHMREQPLRFMLQPTLLLQSLLVGIGTVTVSFGYLFLPASVTVTVVRAGSLLWAILSGSLYFKERNFILKIVGAILCIVGLLFLANY